MFKNAVFTKSFVVVFRVNNFTLSIQAVLLFKLAVLGDGRCGLALEHLFPALEQWQSRDVGRSRARWRRAVPVCVVLQWDLGPTQAQVPPGFASLLQVGLPLVKSRMCECSHLSELDCGTEELGSSNCTALSSRVGYLRSTGSESVRLS